MERTYRKMEKRVKGTFIPRRWAYGTKKKTWYLVSKKDEDFENGITQREFRALGADKAREKYLSLI